ncbi:hypothetical protein IV38_GL000117 [Lactobacillus selangorensis]|uniref:Peptidase M23 n=1 Tax=Lactobacillus selangorensis TaxID=81857 RepID=A0A0R2G395_9LACO|nr:phage tail protein [Lactobacillus selangorensis]KRN29237.1 hypothetical protein IV38_GL000117 [Lactobacillus selangorensis]KRN31405.1 hypothetical protein IV40_GL001401 [Lactobacillus selangorensis]
MKYTIIAYDQPDTRNGYTIHNPLVGKSVSAGTLTLKESEVNDLSLTVNQDNPLFNNVKPMQTHVEVYDEGYLIFRGRALKPTKEMKDSGQFLQTYVFEDIQSYLIDSVQRFITVKNATPKQFLQQVLDEHNAQVPDYKKFVLRNCDVTNSKDDASRQVDYATTADVIKNLLTDSIGGYIITEFKDGKNYLDYLQNPGTDHKTDTPIAISRNLKSASVAIDPSKVITRLIPLGAEVDVDIDKDSGGSSGTDLSGPTEADSSGWSKVIKFAAQVTNTELSDSALQTIINRINQESGGSESVTNNWDSNAAAGTPSTGLLQYIQPTFDFWAISPYTNINKGWDQLLAMFNDSNWLSDISAPGGWGPTGSKRFTGPLNINIYKPGTGGSWGWPFPDVGEGSFTGGQLFGVHAGGEFRPNGYHDGLDFGSVDHPGSQVHAIHGGTVIQKGYMGGLNYYFVVKSGDGLSVVYQEAFGSMGDIYVSEGQKVSTGDVVGIRTTDHLHVGITKIDFNTAVANSFSDAGCWIDPQATIKSGYSSGSSGSGSSSSSADNSGPRPKTTVADVNGGKDYIDIPDFQKEFGVINGFVTFDDIKDPTALMAAAQTWIKNQKASTNSWTVSAIELPEFDWFKVYDRYMFINPYVASEQLLTVVSKKIDLLAPQKSVLTIGDKTPRLTDYQNETEAALSEVGKLKNTIATVAGTVSSIRNGSADTDAIIESIRQAVGGVDVPQMYKDVEGILDSGKDTEKRLSTIEDDVKGYDNSFSSIEDRLTALEKKGSESNGS